jgi:hypothetical protein
MIGQVSPVSQIWPPPAVALAPLSEDDGRRLLEIVLGATESPATWQRAQLLVLAAQALPAEEISVVMAIERETVDEVVGAFNRDGFATL